MKPARMTLADIERSNAKVAAGQERRIPRRTEAAVCDLLAQYDFTLPVVRLPLTVTVDMPPRELRPNARVNHWRKSAAVKEYRNSCVLLIRQQIGRKAPTSARLVLNAQMMFTMHRKRDDDNLKAALKYAIDALALAGIVVDDNQIRIGRVGVTVDSAAGAREMVVMTLEEGE